MAIITGILLGLSTLLFIGPVFFYLIQTTLENGIKSGMSVAFGIILGDIICVLLAVYGVGKYLENNIVQYWFTVIGGVLLIVLGIKSILSPSQINFDGNNLASKKVIKTGLNGFLINFINPFVFAVWFGFYTYLKNKYTSSSDVNLALVFILLTIFITDLIKTFLAQKVKQFITLNTFSKFLKIIGLVMICFGIRLLYLLFTT